MALKETENFYVKWSDDRLVIDKWFSLQTSLSPPSKSLKIAKTLTRHCDFNEKNPNRFRATIGGFSQNLAAFHEQDGEGYKFVTDWIKKIDALNPQLAARTCTAFQSWKQFDDLRQEKISFELTKILKVGRLSKDTTEMITRMLD
jgi:aminopeptidase N